MIVRKLTVLVCALTLSGAILPLVGQSRFTADKIVAVVGNSSILYSDLVDTGKQLVQERREQGYTSDRDPLNEALEKLLMQKLLYNQALIDSIEIYGQDAIAQNVNKRVEEMTEQAGSVLQLEALYHKPVFEIKDDLKNRYEEQQYAQTMQTTIMNKVKITPGEVARYYRSIGRDSLPVIPEQYVYAQITRYPASVKEAKQRAREKLLALRERINNGDKFDILARMYSEDTNSATLGGDLGWMQLDQLEKPFADALSKLQPDQVSGIVETSYGFHIIQLIEKKGSSYHSRHILVRPSYSSDELVVGARMLDSLVHVIRVDSLTFEKAAMDYSDDKYSKQNGGLVTNHEMLEFYGANDTSYSSTKFYKENLNRDDYNALKSLKVGEISLSFNTQDMKGNPLSKVVKLLEIIPSHEASLNEDYLDLERVALQQKQEKEFEKWLDGKIEAMYVRIDPEFRNGAFENKHWIK